LIFTFAFAFIVVPSSNVTDSMFAPRLVALGVFLGVWFLAHILTDAESRLSHVPATLRSLRPYEWALGAYVVFSVVSALLSPIPGYALFGDPVTLTGV